MVQVAVTRHGTRRIELVDTLRGLVIAFMALDHVRDWFHVSAVMFDPTDPARTTPMLFFTRWITHLCAPTFVFLAGVGAYLQRTGARDPESVPRYLVTRGLWLVFLEMTLVSFAVNFGVPYFFFQVIWAIGISMVLLAAMLKLPRTAVLAIGAIIVVGHDALLAIDPARFGSLVWLWRLAFVPGPLGSGAHALVAYPAIPWLGVMCLGYGLGPVFTKPERERTRTLLVLAACALAAFFVVRGLNVYGDPAPWSTQRDGVRTVLSFFRVTKYPPSLGYVLVTLGTSIPLGIAASKLRGLPSRVLLAYGRTPLFTYLVHIYLVHGLALVWGLLAGFPALGFTHFLTESRRLGDEHWGISLGGVYLVWLGVLAVLYPLSRWYMRVKQEHRRPWMDYL